MIMADIEYKSTEEIKQFQEELLAKALRYLNENSAYYKRMFRKWDIDIEKIKTIEDLVKIPFTEKKDLQLFNEDFLCCPKEKVIDYITTSGTLGDPVTFGCTDSDLDRLAYNEKKSFECAGVKPGNIVQLMTTLDKRFMAGLAYFLGIRKLGASVIRVGNGIPELQWDTIKRIKPDTIMCVPSFILRLIEYAEENGIDYRNSSIRRIMRDFQSVVGIEAREQFLDMTGELPDAVVACVGGGSNAMGLFSGFLNDPVDIYGVEPLGRGIKMGDHAASLTYGEEGIMHGFNSIMLKDENGDPAPVYSVASGLDYPSCGPEHAFLHDLGRVKYDVVTDDETIDAFFELSRMEGIIPAIESSHAVAYGMKLAKTMGKGSVLINLSGRGDKDMDYIIEKYGIR